jgi:hypothetical protein
MQISAAAMENGMEVPQLKQWIACLASMQSPEFKP